MTIDPTLALAARLLLAGLFAASAAHKLRDLSAFAASVRTYELLPDALVTPVAGTLSIVEVLVCGALLLPGARVLSSVGAVALLGVYTIAVVVNLVRGRRDIDCGCFGPAHRQSLSEWLVVRNVLLIVVAGLAGQPVADRPWGWMDSFSVAAACLAIGLLWTAANQLVSQWPRMQALRRMS